ncbi:YfiR family protein [Massilia sp. DWR3-1-1]|uniref:YfiR family protein n=1 Tax=Massilia sp. DWR3-1-1 TaxID=2804559 RepID=UPI003CE91B3C
MVASSRRAGPRRQLLVAVCALACATLLAPAMAHQTDERARSVKAAFLVKFLDYADFPAHAFSDAGAALVIGVLGADEMAHEVQHIVGARAINGRPVMVRPVREGDTAPVHLLFVAGSDSMRVTRVLRQWAPAPILLVSECGHGLEAGSTINFKIIEQHVRFDVSLDAAEKSNIKLSSRLLSVANHVSKGVP